MTVVGDFSVRGGIKTVVTATYSNLKFTMGIYNSRMRNRNARIVNCQSVNCMDPSDVPIERELDLHAFAPRDIPSVVEEYVEAAVEAGISEVRLVHGRGRGVQRGIVQAALERHPLVVEFWDDPPAHLGATMAVLKSASEIGI